LCDSQSVGISSSVTTWLGTILFSLPHNAASYLNHAHLYTLVTLVYYPYVMLSLHATSWTDFNSCSSKWMIFRCR
jgi:hypothetical protein